MVASELARSTIAAIIVPRTSFLWRTGVYSELRGFLLHQLPSSRLIEHRHLLNEPQ